MRKNLSNLKIGISNCYCCLPVFMMMLLLTSFYCRGQLMVWDTTDNDSDLKCDEVLNLDLLYHRKCNNWQNFPEIEKVKVYDYTDSNGIKQNYIKAKFGDIDYIYDNWVCYEDFYYADKDLPAHAYDFKYISTYSPDFEFLGYHVGQCLNVDSVSSLYNTEIAQISNSDLYKISFVPKSWNIIVRNDTVRMFILNFNRNRNCKENPKYLIDPVMLSNYNHIATRAYYPEYIAGCKRDDKRREISESQDKARRKTIEYLTDNLLRTYYDGFGIMIGLAKGYNESSDIPIRPNNYKELNDTLKLERFIENMPLDFAEIDEVQHISNKRMHTFVDCYERRYITKPYIIAKLYGIEYMLMLDYSKKYDRIYVSKVMTYDPSFRLTGRQLSDITPKYFSSNRQNYDLSDNELYHPWHYVAKDNKIVYFYKNISCPTHDWNLKHLPNWAGSVPRVTDIIDEVMLKQYKP